MLNLRKVLGAKPKEHVVVELAEMLTPWGEALDPAHVLEEHPTPQFARDSFQTLNGEWSCAFVTGTHEPTDNLEQVVAAAEIPAGKAFDQRIVVPFSPESPLSGVRRQLQPTELLWYRATVDFPHRGDGERVLLHFQGVDYACAVRVNGQLAGTHAGGYAPFAFDVTDLAHDGENGIDVCVADPSEFGGHLRGKQRFDRGDIWYTAQSGIWQPVWAEVVPADHIASIDVQASADGILSVGLRLQVGDRAAAEAGAVTLEVFDDFDNADARGIGTGAGGAREASAPIATARCEVAATCALALHIPGARTWSPDDPHLYRLRLTFGDDVVNSYCGFRTVEMATDGEGHRRVFLNGEPLFMKGVLDQGYWSDGLMTAPADDALAADIEAMRDCGFNMMRKHIKLESERWYYHCDRLGMLVLQDMLCGGAPEINLWHWSYKPTLFKFSWSHYRDDTPGHWDNLGAGDPAYRTEWSGACRETIEVLGNHPSIIGWSLFNEGWGQFCAADALELARTADPTRIIDAVSGWYDQRCGDFKSVHNYFRDLAVWPDRRDGRAFFVSEFGGLVHRVDGHSSLDEAYGYETYDDLGEWRQAVRRMLDHMDGLDARGLAGYVYTQVSDIEEETNGILTYDRKVNKLACETTIE